MKTLALYADVYSFHFCLHNSEAKAVYHFNNEHFTINIPLLLGGKSTEELHFPPALSTPSVSLPQFGLEIVSMEIPIPKLVVPESFTLSIPLFGKAEVSTLMKSNLYEMEASMAAVKDVMETPSYSAEFEVKGTSPIDILSIKMKGISYFQIRPNFRYSITVKDIYLLSHLFFFCAFCRLWDVGHH